MFSYLRDMSMLRKLVALGVLALILELAPTAWVIQLRQQALQTSANQAAGAEKVRALLSAVQLVQQHRGLSNGVLSGNEGLDAQRKGVAAGADAQWANVERLLGQAPGATQQTAADAAGNWRALADRLAEAVQVFKLSGQAAE